MTSDPHHSRWGDPAKAGPVPESMRALIDAAFQHPEPRSSAPLEALVPGPCALSSDQLAALAGLVGAAHVDTTDETRTRHAGGCSTVDLLHRREGDLRDAPDAIVLPGSHDDVAAILRWAGAEHVAVIPFGGGTSVVGGLSPDRSGFTATIALDLRRMNRLLAVDETSMTATLEPGMRGPEAEAALAPHGMTIGHLPQSFQYATIGGFAAARSSGQSSAGYGRFDQMVTGLRVATPAGDLDLGRGPQNAAGPDLRQLIVGSEGAFGVITSVTVRTRPLPSERWAAGVRMPSFAEGAAALRELNRSRLPLTVVRLSDEAETAINLANPDAIGSGEDPAHPGSLLIIGVEGDAEQVARGRDGALAILARHGGGEPDEPAGEHWYEGRFNGPYLRDGLLDAGVLVDTLETVTNWSDLEGVHDAVGEAIHGALGETPHIVLCHVSHLYETGASLYFTVAARSETDPIAQWQTVKKAASDAMTARRASITHHHAIGRDHQPWLEREIGPVGIGILQAVKAELDPHGILNPGILVPAR
ncbi:MAG: FAD-binding oxidoreductase [Baekduia sp.]